MTPERRAELTFCSWPDGRPKIAPVQGYVQGIPWSLHLKAYDAYCKEYGQQEALIDLAGRNCRGGFGVYELDHFVPGWREEVAELSRLRRLAERQRAVIKALREALNLGLSMLRGYAAEHRVPINDQIVDQAQTALAHAKELDASE